jgi:hypothetical protein
MRKTFKSRRWSLAFALSAVLGVPSLAGAIGGYTAFKVKQREHVAVDALPPGVRSTLEHKASGKDHRISKLEEVTFDDGHVTYQAEITRPARYPLDVEIAPSGKLLGQWQRPVVQGTGP